MWKMHPLCRVETTELSQHFDEDLCEEFSLSLSLFACISRCVCLCDSKSNGKNKMKIQFHTKYHVWNTMNTNFNAAKSQAATPFHGGNSSVKYYHQSFDVEHFEYTCLSFALRWMKDQPNRFMNVDVRNDWTKKCWAKNAGGNNSKKCAHKQSIPKQNFRG